MTRPSARKVVILLGAGGAVALAVLARVHWPDIVAWYRFTRIFESVGANGQGYPEYRHRLTGILMVGLPSRAFLMGSPESEAGGWSNERPRHEVRLDGFLIAKYEVSQAEWKRLMGHNPSAHAGDELPVEMISWHDCREFCEKAGLVLPSEAQWEFACRGGTTTAFAFGDAAGSDQMNSNGNFPYGGAPTGEYRRRTVEVRAFGPNPFGLYNAHGNVWEWCADVYDEDFYARPESRRRNPLCTTGGGNRVLRGGGWYDRGRYCRSASRSWQDPSHRAKNIGFRPVFNPSDS